jgi:hypothetical protein
MGAPHSDAPNLALLPLPKFHQFRKRSLLLLAEFSTIDAVVEYFQRLDASFGTIGVPNGAIFCRRPNMNNSIIGHTKIHDDKFSCYHRFSKQGHL